MIQALEVFQLVPALRQFIAVGKGATTSLVNRVSNVVSSTTPDRATKCGRKEDANYLCHILCYDHGFLGLGEPVDNNENRLGACYG